MCSGGTNAYILAGWLVLVVYMGAGVGGGLWGWNLPPFLVAELAWTAPGKLL